MTKLKTGRSRNLYKGSKRHTICHPINVFVSISPLLRTCGVSAYFKKPPIFFGGLYCTVLERRRHFFFWKKKKKIEAVVHSAGKRFTVLGTKCPPFSHLCTHFTQKDLFQTSPSETWGYIIGFGAGKIEEEGMKWKRAVSINMLLHTFPQIFPGGQRNLLCRGWSWVGRGLKAQRLQSIRFPESVTFGTCLSWSQEHGRVATIVSTPAEVRVAGVDRIEPDELDQVFIQLRQRQYMPPVVSTNTSPTKNPLLSYFP